MAVASLCAYSPCPSVSHYAAHPVWADRQPVWTSYCDNYRAVAVPHGWNACGEHNSEDYTHIHTQTIAQLNWPKTFAIFRVVFIIVKQLAVLLRIVRIIVGLFILRLHLKACRGLQILKARRFILVTKTTLDGLPARDKTRDVKKRESEKQKLEESTKKRAKKSLRDTVGNFPKQCLKRRLRTAAQNKKRKENSHFFLLGTLHVYLLRSNISAAHSSTQLKFISSCFCLFLAKLRHLFPSTFCG